MNEFKRIIRMPAVLLFFAAVFLLNIGIYLYEQYPNMDMAGKQKETAVYHRLLQDYDGLPLPDAASIEGERMEATAYAVLQNPDSFMLDFYKEAFPDIWLLVSQGKTMEDATYYENAYILLGEQYKYFEEYSARDSRMESEYKQKSNSSVFQNQKSTLLNMEKTLKDFKAISGVKLSLGDDRAITSLIDSPYTDLLLFAFLTFICLSFLTERSTGLWEIVYAAKGGRKRLIAQRVICLLLFAFLGTAVLLLPKLLLSFRMYGGYGQLTRSIQSISLFSKFLVPIHVKGFLILYFLLKLVSAFFVALLIWAVLSTHANAGMAVFLVSVFLALEYSLYTLPENSLFAAAKYINVFSYIQPAYLLEAYHNVPFFGGLQNISHLSIYLILPMIALVAGVQVLWLSQKRPGDRSALGEKLFDGITRFAARITPYVPSLFREFHKKLFLEKWLLPLCILVFLAFSYQAPQSVIQEEDVYKQFYYQQFHSMAGEELTQALIAEKRMIEENINELQGAFESESGDRQFGALVLLEQFTNRQSAVESIAQEVQEIDVFNQENEVKTVLSDPYLVEAILGIAGNDYRNIRSLLVMLFIVLLSSSLVPFERQENVLPIFKATRGGAALLWREKLFVHFFFVICIYLCLYGPEFKAILSQKYISFGSAVQSFPSFRSFPYNISFAAFCAMLYGYRFVIALGLSFFVIFLSSFMKNAFKCVLLLTSSIMIPNAIIAFAGDQFYRYSLILPFSAVWPISEKAGWVLLAYPALFLVLGGVGARRMKRVQ